jgi:AcrR family transcriptional regulator
MKNNLVFSDNHIPSRADAIQNRALLLQTAQRLFEDHGVEAVSMSQIAREAEVGKGTLYRHFQNKVELCQALLDESQRALQERTFDYLRENVTPYEKLQWFLEQVVNYVWHHGSMLYVNEGALGAALLSHPAHLWWRNTILGLLTQMEFRDSYLADVMYIMLDPSTICFQRHTLGYTREQVVTGIHDTLLRLIR